MYFSTISAQTALGQCALISVKQHGEKLMKNQEHAPLAITTKDERIWAKAKVADETEETVEIDVLAHDEEEAELFLGAVADEVGLTVEEKPKKHDDAAKFYGY